MSNKWKIVKIPDVLFFQEGPGVRNYQYTTVGVKLFNVANLSKNAIDLDKSERYISEEEAYGKYKHFLCNEGDFVIASSGITINTYKDKMGFVKKEHLPLCMNTSTIRFRTIDNEILNIRFFMYFIKSDNYKSQISRLITGAVILNYGPSHLKKINLPLPSISKQQEIAGLLDKARELVEKHKVQLAELDLLAESVFYDMFGDPVSNEKGWDVKSIGNVCSVGTGGTPSRELSEIYYDGDISWVKTTEVKNCTIYDTDEKITSVALRQTNCKIYPINTILLAMYGQGKTRGQVARLAIEAATNQACAAIIPDNDVNYIYLYNFLLINYQHIRSLGRGGNQENLNLSLVRSINIYLPPLPLQTQFANRIEKIDLQKSQVRKALKESEDLFQRLMQDMFNPEYHKQVGDS